MCFGRPKRDPRIEQEQAAARAEAEAAKEAALKAKEAQRQKLLEQERAAASGPNTISGRQSETGKTVSGQLTNTGLSKSRMGKRRGRGSLMTSSGSGIGYYNENM